MCFTVIRASVPKLELDQVFEQKTGIARVVENELEKVANLFLSKLLVLNGFNNLIFTYFFLFGVLVFRPCHTMDMRLFKLSL